jgi:DNA-binding transcriptional ArsR family regulator
VKTKTNRPGQRGKKIEERIAYALGHRVRIEILRRLLTEGPRTADDLAEVIGESRQNVHHHLKELLGGGMIEIAKVEKKRNADLHYFCALEQGSFDRERLEDITAEQQREIVGMVVQHSLAELMAALGAGTLSDDPRVCLMWNWLHLDPQGREALHQEQEQFWKRIEAIEAESLSRSVESGEPTNSYIVSQWGFERAEIAPGPSADADKSAKSF